MSCQIVTFALIISVISALDALLEWVGLSLFLGLVVTFR